MEISCAQKVAKALCDCANIMPAVPVKDRLILAQAMETLTRSIEVLARIEKEAE